MITLPKEVAEYFPYASVRPNQDQFINTIFDAVEDRRSVLIEGSNGLGKTISAISACLPTAIEKDLKILYVARTHRQHDRVVEELRAIFKKHHVSGISLRGRNQMCLNNFAAKNAYDAKSLMEACELLKAKGRCPYHKAPDEQTYEYLQLQQHIAARPYTASEIQKVCRRRKVCSYELVKAALADVKVVALSYLYVFDPVIRNAFLKNLDSQLQKTILIVDEAHNLPDTAIDISSSSLSLFVIKQAELEAKKYKNKQIEEFANFFRKEIEKLTEDIGREQIIAPESIIEIIKNQGTIANPLDFFEELHEVGSSIRRNLLVEGKSPRSYIHGLSEFLFRWLDTLGDESFINLATTYFT
ncbi:MAG: DEAD/DEAH box helicase family protein, partial [Candidatus Bathyarchaeia archaeon]|nr:DEAD/DEAH box helicase family protein [Candidatus Bathyarchaeia archaeon]